MMGVFREAFKAPLSVLASLVEAFVFLISFSDSS